MKKINYSLFISLGVMFISWGFGYLFHALYQVHYLKWEFITDFSAIYLWSGLIALITSVLIVPILVSLANKIKYSRVVFILISTLLAPLVMSIFLLPINNFRLGQMGSYYYTYSSIIGLLFGVLYVLFIKYNKLFNLTKYKVAVIVIPIVTQFLIYFLLPVLAPKCAYVYFGENMRNMAISYVLENIEAGDDVKDINKKIPNLIKLSSSNGETSGFIGGIQYNIVVTNDKIQSIEINHKK